MFEAQRTAGADFERSQAAESEKLARLVEDDLATLADRLSADASEASHVRQIEARVFRARHNPGIPYGEEAEFIKELMLPYWKKYHSPDIRAIVGRILFNLEQIKQP